MHGLWFSCWSNMLMSQQFNLICCMVFFVWINCTLCMTYHFHVAQTYWWRNKSTGFAVWYFLFERTVHYAWLMSLKFSLKISVILNGTWIHLTSPMTESTFSFYLFFFVCNSDNFDIKYQNYMIQIKWESMIQSSQSPFRETIFFWNFTWTNILLKLRSEKRFIQKLSKRKRFQINLLCFVSLKNHQINQKWLTL